MLCLRQIAFCLTLMGAFSAFARELPGEEQGAAHQTRELPGESEGTARQTRELPGDAGAEQ